MLFRGTVIRLCTVTGNRCTRSSEILLVLSTIRVVLFRFILFPRPLCTKIDLICNAERGPTLGNNRFRLASLFSSGVWVFRFCGGIDSDGEMLSRSCKTRRDHSQDCHRSDLPSAKPCTAKTTYFIRTLIFRVVDSPLLNFMGIGHVVNTKLISL